MTTTIFQAPVCNLKTLDNLFIELTAKNCNQRCKHCYIDFPFSKNVKDFISPDLIKNALEETKDKNLKCIYLTGAEPMTHPDFNMILRMCLKYNNVCICTNGSFINEKKARFLRKVQDEGDNEIIFKLSLDSYDELKNDEIRSRGSYRQVLCAIKHLIKYNFNPIVTVTNYYEEDHSTLLGNLKSIFRDIGFDAQDRNICINTCYKNNSDEIINEYNGSKLDCEYGRMLTAKGVYTCSFLANDHRGRCGSDFSDFSDKAVLESEYCNTCLKNKRQVFGIDFSEFNS